MFNLINSNVNLYSVSENSTQSSTKMSEFNQKVENGIFENDKMVEALTMLSKV